MNLPDDSLPRGAEKPPAPRGFFVTGTDTGVGKTVVSCAIVRGLRKRGLDAVGFKPVASGAVDGRWEDADALWNASDRVEPLDLICPIRLRAPLAPTLAAEAENLSIDLHQSRKALRELQARHDIVIVEGVGGLFVPLDRETTVVDFIAECGLPTILVCRAGLGTINHTLLSLSAVPEKPVAIIMNVTRTEDAALAAGARNEILRLSGTSIQATLPYVETERRDAVIDEALASTVDMLVVMCARQRSLTVAARMPAC